MVGNLLLGWETDAVRDCSGLRHLFRKRVLVISFTTHKTFEMVLAVSFNRLSSRLTSKDSLVDNLIIEMRCKKKDRYPLDGE